MPAPNTDASTPAAARIPVRAAFRKLLAGGVALCLVAIAVVGGGAVDSHVTHADALKLTLTRRMHHDGEHHVESGHAHPPEEHDSEHNSLLHGASSRRDDEGSDAGSTTPTSSGATSSPKDSDKHSGNYFDIRKKGTGLRKDIHGAFKNKFSIFVMLFMVLLLVLFMPWCCISRGDVASTPHDDSKCCMSLYEQLSDPTPAA